VTQDTAVQNTEKKFVQHWKREDKKTEEETDGQFYRDLEGA